MEVLDHNFNDSFVIDDYEYNYDYDYGNYTFSYELVRSCFLGSGITYLRVISWIVICLGFPLTIFAIYALHLLVKNNHVAPVYVINLLISDLVQMCCMVIWVLTDRINMVLILSEMIHFVGLMTSVGFMVCIALERYLVIACPLWYRFKRTIRLSVLVSVAVWVISITVGIVAVVAHELPIIRCVFLLLPFPLLLFSLGGTLHALSGSSSIHVKEKRRIIGTLVLVLLNYTVLFLPMVILLLLSPCRSIFFYDIRLGLAFLQFSPLADLVLYVFMRKGAVDKLLARMCCCREEESEEEQGQGTKEDDKIKEEASSV